MFLCQKLFLDYVIFIRGIINSFSIIIINYLSCALNIAAKVSRGIYTFKILIELKEVSNVQHAQK